jgi:hypothetical protein
MLYGVWQEQASRGRERIIGVLSRLLDWSCLLFGGLVSSPESARTNFPGARKTRMRKLTNSISVLDEPYVQA